MNDDIIELKERLALAEQAIERQNEKFDYTIRTFEEKLKETKDILDSIKDINVSVVKLTEQIKYNSQEVSDMKTKIESITARPGERWEKVATTVVTAIVSGIIALAITLIFK